VTRTGSRHSVHPGSVRELTETIGALQAVAQVP
jgi:hypothetical protein